MTTWKEKEYQHKYYLEHRGKKVDRTKQKLGGRKGKSGKLLSFEKVLEIKELREQGLSLRKIAEKTTLCLVTIDKYIKILKSINFEVKK